TKAVDGVSLTVGDGELVCLLGPSGSGKSTVLRMIGGFAEPSAGSVVIDGEDVTGLPPERRPTGMVFQSHALWSHMSVFGNIAFGLKLRRLSKAEIADKVNAVLELVGLTGYGVRRPHQLSGGQQQRVALARSIGTMNLIEGEVRNGRFRLSPLDVAVPIADGKATLAVRPEFLRLSPSVGADAATVHRVIDYGTHLMVDIELPGGARLKSMTAPIAGDGRCFGRLRRDSGFPCLMEFACSATAIRPG